MSPPTATTRRALARCLLCAAIALFALISLDALVFRTEVYTQFLSPASTAGIVQRVIRGERARTLTAARRVVVVGDSQIAEGFSAKTAERLLTPRGIGISNVAIPGTTPRDWFYLLRELDPGANRYNVIALPLRDYGDFDPDQLVDRVDDLNYMVGCLRLSDLYSFPSSYPRWSDKFPIFRGTLLKGLTYRPDVSDFLQDPKERMRVVSVYRQHGWGWEWGYDYTGDPHDLKGLSVDPAGNTLVLPPGLDPQIRAGLIQRYASLRQFQVNGARRAYLKKWLGAIVDRYRQRDVQFLVYRMPQFAVPLHRPPSNDQASFVDSVRQNRRVTVIDEQRFEDLERPEFFKDGLHLGAAGRNRFSSSFADAIAELWAPHAL